MKSALDLLDKHDELTATIERTEHITKALIFEFLDNGGERRLKDDMVAGILWQVEKNLGEMMELARGMWLEQVASERPGASIQQ